MASDVERQTHSRRGLIAPTNGDGRDAPACLIGVVPVDGHKLLTFSCDRRSLHGVVCLSQRRIGGRCFMNPILSLLESDVWRRRRRRSQWPIIDGHLSTERLRRIALARLVALIRWWRW